MPQRDGIIDMDSEALVTALERITIGAVGLTARAFSEARPGVDITLPQWRALMILSASSDGARIGEVAGRLGVTLPATGRLLRRLERRGLLAMATDPEDRRATRAQLTEEGRGVVRDILEHRRGGLRRVAAAVAGGGPVDLAGGLDVIGAELDRLI